MYRGKSPLTDKGRKAVLGVDGVGATTPSGEGKRYIAPPPCAARGQVKPLDMRDIGNGFGTMSVRNEQDSGARAEIGQTVQEPCPIGAVTGVSASYEPGVQCNRRETQVQTADEFIELNRNSTTIR
jgi:hypothetical protein